MKFKTIFSLLLFGVLAFLSVSPTQAHEADESPTTEAMYKVIENETTVAAQVVLENNAVVDYAYNGETQMSSVCNEINAPLEGSAKSKHALKFADTHRRTQGCFTNSILYTKSFSVPVKQISHNIVAYSC
jgi:hypothetical protein